MSQEKDDKTPGGISVARATSLEKDLLRWRIDTGKKEPAKLIPTPTPNTDDATPVRPGPSTPAIDLPDPVNPRDPRKPLNPREPKPAADDAKPTRSSWQAFPNPLPGCDDDFCEPPSAPSHLIPKPMGATTSSVRFASFIDEMPLGEIRLGIEQNCLSPHMKSSSAILETLISTPCPVFRLGYIAGHVQRWSIHSSALGELVHSMSLAPGESRNVAMLDWRRRQRGERFEDTDQSEQLLVSADHNRALSEVAKAVAMEQQFGQTMTAANSMASAGSVVVAGGLVGGVAGGLIGSAVSPGSGTLIGAAVGGAAGVAAGGLVVAGANAVGMIMSESSGERDVVSTAHQRINQSTEQQSANIRSLWSTVVVEDSQDESIAAQSTNVTNYNHMHALNMQYYEVLHEYRVSTDLDVVEPTLMMPYSALAQFTEEHIKRFWHSLRSGLPEDLQSKGDEVYISPPPSELPAPTGTRPDTPDDLADWELKGFRAVLEIPFTSDLIDLLQTINDPIRDVLGDLFSSAALEIYRAGTDPFTVPGVRLTNIDLFSQLIAAFSGGNALTENMLFEFRTGVPIDASRITGVRVTLSTPFLINPLEEGLRRLFQDGLNFTYRQTQADIISGNGMFNDDQLTLRRGELDFVDLNSSAKQFAWDPLRDLKEDQQAEWEAFNAANAPWLDYDAALAQYNARVAELALWQSQIEAEINSDPSRYTRILLTHNPGYVSEILDACFLHHKTQNADDDNTVKLPLYKVVDTTAVGFSDRYIVLRLRQMRHMAGLPDEPSLEQVARILMAQFGLATLDSELAVLLLHSYIIESRFKDDREKLKREATVFLPGQGLFAEAVLGLSNSAEYINLRRYWNWQDSPIPNPAPGIAPLNVQSLAQSPLDADPTTAAPTLQTQQVQFPDFQGLGQVLQAVQNGDMFRDMSKADQLTSIIQGLSKLAGDMGNSAASMTGQAASDALNQAGEIGKVAADLAKTFSQMETPTKRTPPPGNITEKAGSANALTPSLSPEKQAQAIRDTLGIDEGGSSTEESSGGGSSSPGSSGVTFPPPDPLGSSSAGTSAAKELQELLDDYANNGGDLPEFGDVLLRWFDDAVEPRLLGAQSNHHDIMPAISDYMAWRSNVEFLDDENSELLERSQSATDELILPGLMSAYNQINDNLANSDNLDRDLARASELLGTYVSFGGEEYPSLKVSGLLTVSELSPASVAPGDTITIKGRVGYQADGGAVAYNEAFRVSARSVEVKGNFIQQTTDATGNFTFELEASDNRRIPDGIPDVTDVTRPNDFVIDLHADGENLALVFDSKRVAIPGQLLVEYLGFYGEDEDTTNPANMSNEIKALKTHIISFRIFKGLLPLAQSNVIAGSIKANIPNNGSMGIGSIDVLTDNEGIVQFEYFGGIADVPEDRVDLRIETPEGTILYSKDFVVVDIPEDQLPP
ncbi:MAG: hypothetical protein AB8B57_14170 [Congregibacter sp.]